MGKVKILHVTSTTTGGSAFSLLLLLKYLDRKVFDISIAMPPDGPFYCDIVKTQVQVYPLTISRQPFHYCNIRGFRQLRKILQKGMFDIVHTHTSVGGFLGRIAAKSVGIPCVIWTIHGWAFNYSHSTFVQRRFFKTIEKFLDRFTDHYVAVSRNMLEVGIQARVTISEKVSVIYHGIETDENEIRVHHNNLRKELGIGEDIPLVGNIGRIEPQKAVDDFLRAARIIKDAIPNVNFLVVGDGPLRNDMEKLSMQLGIKDVVLFTGWKKNVKEYMDIIDVVCIPSLWEALPFLLLEAMYTKKPVVATHVGGIPEVVDDGKTGILVPPSRPEVMANAIITLIENKRIAKEMGEAGKRRVQQLFSVEQMITHYEKLYLDLLKKK